MPKPKRFQFFLSAGKHYGVICGLPCGFRRRLLSEMSAFPIYRGGTISSCEQNSPNNTSPGGPRDDPDHELAVSMLPCGGISEGEGAEKGGRPAAKRAEGQRPSASPPIRARRAAQPHRSSGASTPGGSPHRATEGAQCPGLNIACDTIVFIIV